MTENTLPVDVTWQPERVQFDEHYARVPSADTTAEGDPAFWLFCRDEGLVRTADGKHTDIDPTTVRWQDTARFDAAANLVSPSADEEARELFWTYRRSHIETATGERVWTANRTG
jgi:predicted nicotinamide N-methyase